MRSPFSLHLEIGAFRMLLPKELPPTLGPAEAAQLLAFTGQGRLYEIEAWIRDGNSLQVPVECKTTPLRIAMDRGFHSLVLLLARNDVGQRAKNDALWHAVTSGSLEFIELLLNHGAQLSSVAFSEVLLSWKPSVIQFFLDRGADFVTDAPFTKAFVARIRTALRPYLDCKRNHPELTAELQKQADAALRHFCNEGNEKWISLMLWLGANPRTDGPAPGDPDEPEYYTTALRQAGYTANYKVLKLLKLRPETDRSGSSSRHFRSFASVTLRYSVIKLLASWEAAQCSLFATASTKQEVAMASRFAR